MPLRRHPALAGFSREHHSGLLLALVLKKDTPPMRGMPVSLKDKAEYVKAKYTTELAPHFKKEEEILFPQVRSLSKDAGLLVTELIKEHELLQRMIRETGAEEEALDKIGDLLEKHIRKEERILFESVQAALTEEQMNRLGQLLGEL